MRALVAILAALAACLLLASCGGATPQMALKSLVSGDPTKPYLGMSKQDVLACAGQPHSAYESGGGERR
jgi:hypothetical protein